MANFWQIFGRFLVKLMIQFYCRYILLKMYTFSLKHIFIKILQFYDKILQSKSPNFSLQVSIPKMTQFSLDRNCGSHHMLFWPRLVYYWPVLGNFHNFSQTLNFFSNILKTLKVHLFSFLKAAEISTRILLCHQCSLREG